MHAQTHTCAHKQARCPRTFPTPHLFSFWVSLLTLAAERGAESSDHRGGEEMYEGRDGETGKRKERKWQPAPRNVLLPSLPSQVLIQPAEVQTTAHIGLLLSILLGTRWERKWLPAVLPLHGLFPHINTFAAQLHLLHTLQTHTQGEPRAVNDGHMQNCAHL